MSEELGLSNGEENPAGEGTQALDESMKEKGTPNCSTQVEEYDDDYIEPYLTTYHLENLEIENPGEIASLNPESLGGHNPSLSKESALTREGDFSQDPTEEDYKNIEDHEYTYIDEMSSVMDRQGTNEEQASDSVTLHGLVEFHLWESDVNKHDTPGRNDYRIALDRMSNRAFVTETDGHRGQLPVPAWFSKFRGACYKVFKILKTFRQAIEMCHNYGGTLAMPQDAETNAFLVSIYKQQSSHDLFLSNYWIGLHNQRKGREFGWIDGSPLGEYNSWALGQPGVHGNGDNNCVAFDTSRDVPRPEAELLLLL
ncbi:BCAN [Branchiostoma lanceolatum]|uniref:BCAN protein n=1 Tax=Branchiostoma lanceolatum TaxID=7740 RepID=A0A8K0AF07_BRALA|nr:BCAN [Branchiostoma lanceolatum]